MFVLRWCGMFSFSIHGIEVGISSFPYEYGPDGHNMVGGANNLEVFEVSFSSRTHDVAKYLPLFEELFSNL